MLSKTSKIFGNLKIKINMKQKFILFLLIFFGLINYPAQSMQRIIAYVSAGNISFIEIYTDQYVFTLNPGGVVLGFSKTAVNGSFDYFDDDYYDKDKYGKLKNFNDINLDYWLVSSDEDARFVKLKRIGNIEIDYWGSFNYEPEKFGRVKNIGVIPIDYWQKDGFDKAREGKIKSIGSVFIDYWEDMPLNNAKYGKLKNFGSVKFDYWDADINQKGKFGKLKSISGNSEKILVKLISFDGIFSSRSNR